MAMTNFLQLPVQPGRNGGWHLMRAVILRVFYE